MFFFLTVAVLVHIVQAADYFKEFTQQPVAPWKLADYRFNHSGQLNCYLSHEALILRKSSLCIIVYTACTTYAHHTCMHFQTITPQIGACLVSVWNMISAIYLPMTRKNGKRKKLQNLENKRNISMRKRKNELQILVCKIGL